MTLPRTVADVLTDHVVFEVECIDRMYCVYVPQLQHPGGLLGYVQRQLGLPIASTAPLGKITDAFSAAMRRFARDQRVPWVDFAKGQRKDDVMHEHLARFTAEEGVLFVIAQARSCRSAPGSGRPRGRSARPAARSSQAALAPEFAGTLGRGRHRYRVFACAAHVEHLDHPRRPVTDSPLPLRSRGLRAHHEVART
jgi:hypothetical protein